MGQVALEGFDPSILATAWSCEAEGEITQVGNTSRKMRFEARKVIQPRPDLSASAAEVLAKPIVFVNVLYAYTVAVDFTDTHTSRSSGLRMGLQGSSVISSNTPSQREPLCGLARGVLIAGWAIGGPSD